MNRVTFSLVLLIAAIVLFIICALSGFSVITLSNFWGWGFVGFACAAASRLPWP